MVLIWGFNLLFGGVEKGGIRGEGGKSRGLG